MTIKELNLLSKEEIKSRYNLIESQYIDTINTTHHILDEINNIERAKNGGYCTDGYLKKIQNSIDYTDLYKAVKSKHYSFWTGLISRDAYREYYTSLLKNTEPSVTAEHYWNRAKVINNILYGKWSNLLKKYHEIAFIYIYFENPGVGHFHITTKHENSKLSSKEQRNYGISWQEQYSNSGIKLYQSTHDSIYNFRERSKLIGIFDQKTQGFWKYINEDELLEDIELHNIDVSDINKTFNIKEKDLIYR